MTEANNTEREGRYITFNSSQHDNPRKARDRRAADLRKQGFEVETGTSDFSDLAREKTPWLRIVR